MITSWWYMHFAHDIGHFYLIFSWNNIFILIYMYMLITCESSGDVNSYLLLSPMQLLTMKTKVVMPPPRIFQNIYIATNNGDMFKIHVWWVLVKMEKRSLCNTASSTEVESGEKKLSSWRHVLVRDNAIWNVWTMAWILKTYSDKEGLVHSVQLVIGKNSSNSKGDVSIWATFE